ncbi:hypothetical protein [Haladaptatus halobius]|uniref:hypothetical protein n=1 Tax=Haladaptatus halobius TaxID=2884875 RepID=UPI001D0AE88F|nr:hypothetical protein [Haladaptatus halobius]
MVTITDTEVYGHSREVIVELRGVDAHDEPAVHSYHFRKIDNDVLRLQDELVDRHQESVETILTDVGYTIESLTQ